MPFKYPSMLLARRIRIQKCLTRSGSLRSTLCRPILQKLLSTNDHPLPSDPSRSTSGAQGLPDTPELSILREGKSIGPTPRPIQPFYPLHPLPSFDSPDDPSLSEILENYELERYGKGLYKRGWGVIRRDDHTESMTRKGEAEDVPRAARGVALVKTFWFRIDADRREGRIETSGKAEPQCAGLEGEQSLSRGMNAFWERFMDSKWIGHHSVRLRYPPSLFFFALSTICQRKTIIATDLSIKLTATR